MATVTTIGATGNRDIDGLLSGLRWSGVLTYSFTDAASDYGAGYGYGEATASGFAQISAAQQSVFHGAMSQIMAFTNLTIQFAGTNGADIRIAQSSEANPTAYAYMPGSDEGGDIWFGTNYSYRNPKLGDYYYTTHIHELGHALGLKHGHEAEGPANATLPTAHDALEYSVMSYRSYPGEAIGGGYGNETYGFPTTYMMNDIRALQEMYGADFTTSSGDTVYRWSATTGETFIDGVGQGRPGGASAPASANVVFMTVWDGGGNDTYDFSDYTTAVTVNLSPGAFSITSSGQRAYLGDGHSAQGNVYNAYLYNNDTRSYIENAVGGGAGDTLIGNAVENRLDGGAGNDTLTGGDGGDVFVFRSGYGADIVTDYSVGFDRIDLSAFDAYASYAQVMAVASQSGANTLFNFGVNLSLTLRNVTFGALTDADFIFDASGSAANEAPSAIALDNLTVNENQAGAVIGAIAVTDSDDTAFTFSVSDARFQVTGASGAYQLKLANTVSLDYETAASVAVSVTARDSHGQTVAQSFTLTVNDMPGATITGTAGRDTISGTRSVVGQGKTTADDDTIFALEGADVVYGLAGNDTIDGGAGDDSLFGEAGNDRLIGGLGADRLSGGAGHDTFVVSESDGLRDTVMGGDGVDTIEASGTSDIVLTRFSAQTASIEAWVGNGFGVIGTTGADTLDFGALQSVSDLAYIDGGAGNDRLTGSVFDNDLRGGDGGDILSGGRGNDRLTGGAGNDTVDGGLGDDTFVFGGTEAMNDTMRGGGGFDRIEISGSGDVTLSRFDAGTALIEAWHGNDAGVIGTRGADILNFSQLLEVAHLAFIDGGDGNDRITGSLGNDILRGGAGADILTGGLGDDTLFGGAGNDRFIFAAGWGNDVIADFQAGSATGDVIAISRSMFANLAQILAGSQQVGADVVISYGASDSLTLQNLQLSALHANDFAFV